ncbi:peptide/nickel transport system substrate-binding protein [Clostridiales Family XIII bacterium PM5-7]
MLNEHKKSKFSKILSFLHEHIILLIIVIVVIASLASTLFIVKNNSDDGTTVQENITYKPSNTLYFAMDKVKTLNPLTSSDQDTYYIVQLVYSSLFRLNDTLNVKKDVVQKYSTNKSEGKVNITLRKDVKFSDGSKLTASDVSYTVNQIDRIGSSSPYYEYVSKIETVQVTGTYTFTVYFHDSSDAAVDNLIFPIVSSSDYDLEGGRSVGSGQYAFGGYDKTKYLKLKPNEHYFGTVPTNKIHFLIIPDKTKTTGLMTTGAVTAYLNTSLDADADAEDKNLKFEAIPSSEAEFLGFNFKHKELAKTEVRQAIAKAIDVTSIIEDNYGATAIPSDTIYFPGFLGVGKKNDAYPYDQKGAADLLKSAGFEDNNEDGILETKNNKPLSLTLIVNSNSDSRGGTAISIADALEQVGIKVIIKRLSWSAYRNAIEQGDYDLYIGGYQFDKQYNLKELFDFNNDLGYNNKAVISNVNKLETALTAKGQKEAFTSLHQQLIEDIPYYCLCYKTYAFVTVERFNGTQLPSFFDAYRGASTWTWEQTVTVEE